MTNLAGMMSMTMAKSYPLQWIIFIPCIDNDPYRSFNNCVVRGTDDAFVSTFTRILNKFTAAASKVWN